MITPAIPARMKKRRHLTCVRVNAGEVRAFVKITFGAREREIVGGVRSAMLAGNDVFNVEMQT